MKHGVRDVILVLEAAVYTLNSWVHVVAGVMISALLPGWPSLSQQITLVTDGEPLTNCCPKMDILWHLLCHVVEFARLEGSAHRAAQHIIL